MKGLYALKPWYTRRLALVVDLAVRRGISPDIFTAAGVVGAALAAVVIWQGWWPLALVFLVVRLGGANLDGAVARARGVSRPWGFVLNEIGDRASDLIMYAGLAALGARVTGSWTSGAVVLTILAAVVATLPTFASLAAAGAGATRRNGGPLGKTERCALAVVGAAVPGWLGWLGVVVVVGSFATAAVRLRAAHAELSSSGASGRGA